MGTHDMVLTRVFEATRDPAQDPVLAEETAGA